MLLNMARAEIRGGSKYPRIKGIVNFKQSGIIRKDYSI